MPITPQEVEHVVKLARLSLTEQEIVKFQAELSQVLDYVGKLNKVSTKNIKTTGQVAGLSNVFRSDEPVRCDIPLEELLKNAPLKEHRHLKVKAVLEGES